MPLKIDRAAYERLGPGARAEVDAAFVSFAQKAEQNPLVNFFPGEKQKPILAMDTHTMAAFAGNRAGKTACGAVKNIIDALDPADVPEHLLPYKKWDPPFYCRIMAPDFTDYIDAVILPEIRKWVPESALMGGSWEKAWDIGRRTLTFRNGSQFRFFSYKQDVSQLGGTSVHRVHYDEPPPQKHRNECLARLIQYNGDELFTVTPLQGAQWLEKVIWKERHDENVTVVKLSGYDNPVNTKEAVDRIIGKYPEEERKARLYGDFVYFSGRIFTEFTLADHVVPPLRDPRQLAGHEVVVGIDPGWDHGFAVTFNAFDVEGNCLTFDEIHARGNTVAQVIGQIKSKLAYWNIEPAYFVIDSASEQTSVITGYSVRAEFRRYGIICRKAKNTANSWMPSVNRMRTMLATKDLDGNPIPPRLKATENCTYTVDGYLSYHFKDDADDLSVADRNPKPYKKDDDELDTVRYVVMSRTYQDPYFMPKEIEPEVPDLRRVSAMGYHLEQLRREEEQAAYQY